MTHNPYRPPVAAIPLLGLPKRPASVVVAICLVAGIFVAGIFRNLTNGSLAPNAVGYTVTIVSVLIMSGLSSALFFRQNWARWVVVVIMLLGAFTFLYRIARTPQPLDDIFLGARAVAQVVAGILLLMPSAGRWYRAPR